MTERVSKYQHRSIGQRVCVLLEDFRSGWGGHQSEKLVWGWELLGTAWSWCDTKSHCARRKEGDRARSQIHCSQ